MADKPHKSQTSTTFIEGILFPEDEFESSPRMVKVKFDTGYDKGKNRQKPDLSPYLPSDVSIGRQYIDGTTVPKGDILFVTTMIAIFYNERFLEDGSKRNNCISRLTNGKTALPWAGPFFAFRFTFEHTYSEAIME